MIFQFCSSKFHIKFIHFTILYNYLNYHSNVYLIFYLLIFTIILILEELTLFGSIVSRINQLNIEIKKKIE